MKLASPTVEAGGVLCGSINSIDEPFAHRQVKACNVRVTLDHPPAPALYADQGRRLRELGVACGCAAEADGAGR